jgi:SAM-dependent methyltransferase
MRTFDDEWRARFERFGRTYTAEHDISGWSAEGLARRVQLFGQVMGRVELPRQARTLELGCGAGTYVRYLASLGHVVVGVDYALPSLRHARGADPGRKSRYVAGDGYALPFRSDSFDLVVCVGVLQALGRPERLLAETARVLRPRGILLVEGLNGLSLAALGRRLLDMLGGRVSRVRCYSPFRIRHWLKQRAIRPVRRVGVYLPPRSFPKLGRLLDRPGVTRLLEGMPGASLLGAHAFWLLGQKAP